MKYKLYDVGPKGEKIDTGKVLEMGSTGEAVAKVFKCYGFSQYAESYRLQPSGNDVYITYPYQDGVKNTWFVERIPE